MKTKELKVFESKYFKINKWFLHLIGLWPFSLTMLTVVKQIIPTSILLTACVPSVHAIIKWCGTDRLLCGENVGAFLFYLAALLKYSVILLNRKRMIKVYEFVSTNWMSIQDPDEQEIKEKFAKHGREWTMAYTGYLLGIAGFCTQMPLITPVLDFIIPLNESRQKLLTLNAYYGFDPFKYFYELYFGYTMIGYTCVIIIIAFDTTYIAVVHQCIAIFHIVGHRVQKATYKTEEVESCAIMMSAIKLHNSALEFIKIIESAYNLCLLLLLGMTTAGFTVGFVAIVETIHEPLIVTRFLSFAIGISVHLIYITIPGQKVTDATADLFRNLYHNKWYNMPQKRKMFLKVMMMRCSKPSVFTAGGLYQMNLENAGKAIKTIVSYTMVFISIT